MSQKTNKPEIRNIRCLRDKDFFKLMKKENENDCANTIMEQIQTEELVKSSYDHFIEGVVDDPE